MRVKFKNSEGIDGGFITYKVLNPVPVFEYDDVQRKYCFQIEIAFLGLVDLDLLEETDSTDNDAVDIHIQLFGQLN